MIYLIIYFSSVAAAALLFTFINIEGIGKEAEVGLAMIPVVNSSFILVFILLIIYIMVQNAFITLKSKWQSRH